MMSKKPAILLSSYSSLPPFCYTPSQSGTSCRHPHSRASWGTRNYAQHTSSHCEESDLTWPDPVHPHKTPTPYQILAIRRDEAYSKHRFYSLVKLYHPDATPTSPVAHLPHTIRLERYRLLVTAHSILSDDAKRRAYDLWGHGWAAHPQNPSHHSPYPSAQNHWQSRNDPMRNATWEDWEQWYRREHEEQHTQDPRAVAVSNFAFVALIFTIVSLGGVMQGTRANMFSSNIMEHRDKVHKEAATELAKSHRATLMAAGDRDERIQTFLRHRDAIHAGEDAYQRILPPSETCATDTIRKQ
ncbi:uncharacterized protein BDR25DRAFT_303875 [Lindgomyces ingoldianus]|uniref:Uncharacterized protein n=1 Tax=Lindgomyces ingoldianus TaxID=673940 RepID=A0ACB6QTM5_9PLEO|nr:uncharacterized protein BDR25DRAFT_303875 [Lindgomyces ingoldianus]KAF2470349.1 hypothetical protein BDR25DRAFT_303875 [Lindgomyces ingoldianus]